jgi:integrase
MRTMPYSLGWHTTRPKPSGKHEARWADESGKARGKCFNTKAQAAKFARDTANGIVNAAVGLSAPTKDIQEAAVSFLARRILDASNRIYERHLNDFFASMPEIKLTGHLTSAVIERYDRLLEKTGHNPGGRRHIWKTLKTFSNYCIENRWLGTSPFFKLRSPRSTFKARALSPDQMALMTALDARYPVDADINRALRIGNPCMLRISSVWSLTPEHFREPGEVLVAALKGKEAVWVPLHPAALAAVRECLAVTPPGVRFFARWGTIDAMRQSLRKKAARVGLKGVRFHDAAKVSRVTELDAAGYGLGEISELSNTSKITLSKHYIQADRRQAFSRYQKFQNAADEKISGTKNGNSKNLGLPPNGSDLPQTYTGPEMGVNRSNGSQQDQTAPLIAMDITDAERRVILSLRGVK